jgi:hypothetical protein
VHYKGEFRSILVAGDAALLERAAHRSKVTINLLAANRLKALIGEAGRQLHGGQDLDGRQAVAGAIEAEVDAVVEELNRFLRPRA